MNYLKEHYDYYAGDRVVGFKKYEYEILHALATGPGEMGIHEITDAIQAEFCAKVARSHTTLMFSLRQMRGEGLVTSRADTVKYKRSEFAQVKSMWSLTGDGQAYHAKMDGDCRRKQLLREFAALLDYARDPASTPCHDCESREACHGRMRDAVRGALARGSDANI